MRRMFSLPSSAADLAPTFMWNDRDCATPNYFICERLQTNGTNTLNTLYLGKSILVSCFWKKP